MPTRFMFDGVMKKMKSFTLVLADHKEFQNGFVVAVHSQPQTNVINNVNSYTVTTSEIKSTNELVMM